MSIMRWNPWNEVSALQDRINQLFDNTFPASKGGGRLSGGEWSPVVDIFDTEDAVILQAELPGLAREDISVEIKESVLTIKGEKCECTYIDGDSCRQRERCFGVFQRDFDLPAAIDIEKIKARYENGVLELTIPKPELEPPVRITVDID